MKNYVKVILYAYPLLKTVEKDYEEHIRNKALFSYDGRVGAEPLAEGIAEEILRMRRLEWLKGKVQEILAKLTEEERRLVAVRYFGERKLLKDLSLTESTYFRKQRRLGEKLSGLFLLAGISERVYHSDYVGEEGFSKIHECVESGRDKKISAKERRWIATSE